MQTVASYSIEEILPLIGRGKPKHLFETIHGIFKVSMSGARLECFKQRLSCVYCETKGNVFLLQRSKHGEPRVKLNCFMGDCPWCHLHPPIINDEEERPHLNLYYRAKNGALTLFTKDHIFPRCRGGSDDQSNLITCCQPCNSKKGASVLSSNLPKKGSLLAPK